MIWGGVESILNPCTRLDTQLCPGLNPGGGSSLEYECSVTQSLPGYYRYVKWWDGGPILQADPRRKDKSGNTGVAPKGTTPVFPDFPVFLVSRISPLPGFNSLVVFHQRGTKNTGCVCLRPCYLLVTRPHVRLSNQR